MNRTSSKGGGALTFRGLPVISRFASAVLSLCTTRSTNRVDTLLFTCAEGDEVEERKVIEHFVRHYNINDADEGAFDSLGALLRYINVQVAAIPATVINAADDWFADEGFVGLLDLVLQDSESNLAWFNYAEASMDDARPDNNVGWGLYQSHAVRCIHNNRSSLLTGRRIETAAHSSEEQLQRELCLSLYATINMIRDDSLREKMIARLLSVTARDVLRQIHNPKTALKVAS